MSHFYASITGKARRQLTRTGTKQSGLEAHLRGFNNGLRVVAEHHDGTDIYRVYKTGGSHNPTRHQRLIATLAFDVQQ